MGEWPDEIKAVYVLCHAQKEKARYERLMPHLLQAGIPADRIRVCAPSWGSELTVEQIFKVYDPYLKRPPLPTFSYKGCCLTRAEISLGINFCSAVADVVRREDEHGWIMTLESDVWMRRDFLPALRDLVADLKEKGTWDFVSLGEGVGTRPPGALRSYYAPTKAYTPPHQWVFRCTDSMLFTTDYLRRLSRTMLPFKEIIDWEMNFQMMLNQGRPLWADPPLIEQGTWYSRTGSSLWS
jgi:hypothetical protein